MISGTLTRMRTTLCPKNYIDHDIAFSSFIKHLPCFSHTLQLVVGKFDQLSQFKNVLKNARTLVTKVNKSTRATERLVSLCNKKLIGDVVRGGVRRTCLWSDF